MMRIDPSDWGYHSIMHPDEIEEFQTRFQAAAETGTVLEMEMRFKNKAGNYIWHLNQASPIKDVNGDIKMWVGSTTEIQKIKESEFFFRFIGVTEQKRIEKELVEARVFAEMATLIAQEAKSKAEDAVKSKQQFLGGKIQVKSAVNEGTTFSFTLPFQKTDEKAEIQTEIIAIDTDIKNIKVLVVEDMALNQLLMKTVLDDFGFDRDIADNGKIAIEKLTQKDAYGATKDYDIILMDLQMPEMNGFEATEYIRKTLKSKIPIIALTADVTTVDLAKCKAVGMNDYIAKPIDERVLYSKIVSFVKKSVSNSERNEKEMSQMVKQRCTNLEYLMQRTKSNPILMIEMISAYLEQTPPLIHAMKQSFQEKDWTLLHSAVHKMIPSFSIMGISTDFESMAKKVVEYARTQEQEDSISQFVSQLENICTQACEELIEELKNLQNKK